LPYLAIFISHKLRQPATILIIILGVLIGPSLLGLVQYNDMIGLIARLGSIFLLFLAGLTTTFGEIYNRRSIAIGIMGGILPFAGGAAVGLLFGFDLAISIFIGATLTATCIGLTTALLREIGKINTETARIMLGAAVVDDVIGLIVLSVAATIPSGISLISIGMTAALAMGFIGAVAVIGSKLMPRLVDSFDRFYGIELPKLTFMLGIGIVFAFAFLAELIGLAAIVGAFLAGVAMSKSLAIRFLQHGGEYLEAIFASIFFVAIGIAVDVSALFTAWALILILSVVAILTKYFGCRLAAKACGVRPKDSSIIGIGMAPRGEVAFIIALYGLSLGILTKEIYSIIVFVSFITTIFALLVLKRMYERPSSDLEKKAEKKPKKPSKSKVRIIVRNSAQA
jgi:Kef-type K+ transport system membrane component KefB